MMMVLPGISLMGMIHMILPMDMAGFIMILSMTAVGLLNKSLQVGEVRLNGMRSTLTSVIM